MNKKQHAITEHYLVPAVLFLLNVCICHLIYAFVSGSAYTLSGKLALMMSFIFMGASLLIKKQLTLAGSILFYTVVVIWI